MSLAVREGVSTQRLEELEDGTTSDPALAIHLLVAVGRAHRPAGDFDDPALIASQRAMTMGERLESGFALCRFSSALAGAARR